MQANLTFDLDDVFDRQAHLRSVKATDAYLALLGIRDYLFKKVNNLEEDSLEYKVYQDCLRELNEQLDHYSIDLHNEIS